MNHEVQLLGPGAATGPRSPTHNCCGAHLEGVEWEARHHAHHARDQPGGEPKEGPLVGWRQALILLLKGGRGLGSSQGKL
jgi:hypothetical protein